MDTIPINRENVSAWCYAVAAASDQSNVGTRMTLENSLTHLSARSWPSKNKTKEFTQDTQTDSFIFASHCHTQVMYYLNNHDLGLADGDSRPLEQIISASLELLCSRDISQIQNVDGATTIICQGGVY